MDTAVCGGLVHTNRRLDPDLPISGIGSPWGVLCLGAGRAGVSRGDPDCLPGRFLLGLRVGRAGRSRGDPDFAGRAGCSRDGPGDPPDSLEHQNTATQVPL